MKFHPSQTVGQIAVNFKESIPLFEKYKIDYYSEGGRSLEDACYLAGVALDQLSRELEEAKPIEEEWYTEEPDWPNEPMSELAEYIVKKHHAYTRHQLDLIEKMLSGQASVDSHRGPELEVIHRFFLKFSGDMREHML